VKRLLTTGFAVLALLAFVASHVQLTSVVVRFEMNRAALAAAHCVNTDVPGMHCNGACYLSSLLEEAQSDLPVPASATSLVELFQLPALPAPGTAPVLHPFPQGNDAVAPAASAALRLSVATPDTPPPRA